MALPCHNFRESVKAIKANPVMGSGMLEVTDYLYSPTTMYEDYALNEYLFHLQSQNSASPESPVGLSYIKHRERGKKILLFVREQNRDEYGLAMSYVFLGEASFMNSYGARPMNIEWRLTEPGPAGLLKESRKLLG